MTQSALWTRDDMEILAAPALLTRAARCARKAAHPDAAVRLADIVCNVAKPNGGENEKEAAAWAVERERAAPL